MAAFGKPKLAERTLPYGVRRRRATLPTYRSLNANLGDIEAMVSQLISLVNPSLLFPGCGGDDSGHSS